MQPALAEKVGAQVGPQVEETKKNLPPYQGTYHARDLDGKEIEVEVIAVRLDRNAKKVTLCVAEFGENGEHIPASESGLDFFLLISRKGPLPADMYHY